jgi:IS30 family transposase
LLKEGRTQAQIALNLGRNKSTINREIARNTDFRGYRPKQADHLAIVWSEGYRNAPRISAQDWNDVEKKLEKQFSRMLRGLLAQDGLKVCRLHVATLMKRMGIKLPFQRLVRPWNWLTKEMRASTNYSLPSTALAVGEKALLAMILP